MDTADGAATNLNQGITSDSIASIAATLVNADKEKEKRLLNLILHNLNESNNAESFKRNEEDASAVASILKD